ncbi:MAG: hypothetical protein KGL00_10555, partial [Gammaproteobacteria bacterium]|nr:hypothetical protein [Gammaproteobacteria bacterium]
MSSASQSVQSSGGRCNWATAVTPGALDAVLALDRPATLSGAYRLPAFTVGDELLIGPFRAQTALLPHWLPDAGVRLTAGGRTLVYTGDAGAAPEVVALARDADLLLA